MIKLIKGVDVEIVVVAPFGKTIVPEVITSLLITASITVVLPKVEFVITEFVPLTVRPVRLTFVRVAFTNEPPSITEFVTSVFTRLVLFNVEEATVPSLTVESEIIELVVVEFEIVEFDIVEKAENTLLIEDELIDGLTIVLSAIEEAPEIPIALEEAMVGFSEAKNIPSIVEFIIETSESVIMKGPVWNVAEALPATSSALT